MKFKVGDEIKVTLGKDKGKTGKIEKVMPKENKVVVAGVNMYKKHIKPTMQGQAGSVAERIRPLATSKIALVCPKCKKVTRIGYKLDGKEKKRICKKCEAAL
jgi:large subunit ribosomal protein L24